MPNKKWLWDRRMLSDVTLRSMDVRSFDSQSPGESKPILCLLLIALHHYFIEFYFICTSNSLWEKPNRFTTQYQNIDTKPQFCCRGMNFLRNTHILRSHILVQPNVHSSHESIVCSLRTVNILASHLALSVGQWKHFEQKPTAASR